MRYWKLFEKKEKLVLTTQSRLLLLGLLLLAFFWLFTHVFTFLAITDKVEANVLIVEGWLSDHAVNGAAQEFKRNGYQLIVTAGGPLQTGHHLSEYTSLAELTRATLVRLGVDPEKIISVPSAHTRKDRTYAAAAAVSQWLQQSHYAVSGINLFSSSVHARRSHYLFSQAIKGNYPLGVIAYEHDQFDADDWWKSSAGVRAIISETIAIAYAYLVFDADETDEKEGAVSEPPSMISNQ